MPKAYSDKERQEIISQLRKAALDSIMKKGIKKTTVDDLVKQVNIPKGTFYLFYKSKELLIFDAISQKEKILQEEMKKDLLDLQSHLTVKTFTELLVSFYQNEFVMGLQPMLINGEVEALIRKLPDHVVDQSISQDETFLAILNHFFPQMSQAKIAIYAASFRALFLTGLYKREIGEYEEALRLLIRGLVIQMWEDNHDHH